MPDATALQQAVWIDLESPTPEEIALVEAALGINVPTSKDMLEIEASSRIHREDGISYMTALLVAGMELGAPKARPVSFILTAAGNLVTVRDFAPLAFRTARETIARQPPAGSGLAILFWLLDLIIDRTADILELMSEEVDQTSGVIFSHGQHRQAHRLSPLALESLLRRIGTIQFTVNKAHESLQTLGRVATFLSIAGNGAEAMRRDRASRDTLKSISRDISSLTENATYLTQNVFFLLDAAVGRISIEQNLIIKILSVASVVFLPPTLVASIYGMNFAHMPELSSPIAYPLAIAVMLMSAILPFLWFRWKGWL